MEERQDDSWATADSGNLEDMRSDKSELYWSSDWIRLDYFTNVDCIMTIDVVSISAWEMYNTPATSPKLSTVPRYLSFVAMGQKRRITHKILIRVMSDSFFFYSPCSAFVLSPFLHHHSWVRLFSPMFIIHIATCVYSRISHSYFNVFIQSVWFEAEYNTKWV